MMPKVSVLVTTYNHRQFIAEALESILALTFVDIEVIVADDASTDNAQEIIKEFAARDKRIKPILNQFNLGLTRNFNNALQQATGDYLAPFSGDDIMFPGRLEKQISFLENHPEYVACLGDMEVFDSDTGETLYTMNSRFAHVSSVEENLFFTNWLFCKKELKACGSSLLVKRSYYLASLFDVRFPYLNEVLHGIDNFAANPGGKWHTLPEVLGRYRRHADNLSSHITDRNTLEEPLMMYAAATARYPQLAKRIKDKRDFLLFQHLLYDWHPLNAKNRTHYERAFRLEAGLLKYMYLKLCKMLLQRNLLFAVTAPLRRLNRIYDK